MWKNIKMNDENEIPLTSDLIKVASGQFDVAIVPNLTLSRLKIPKLPSSVLSECISLSILDLSYNNLKTTKGIEVLATTLTRLDLRFNKLEALEGVSQLKQLEVLKLQGNQLQSIEKIENLVQCNKLRLLAFQDQDESNANPICKEDKKKYGQAMLRLFPNVRALDGNYFCHEEVFTQKFIPVRGEDDEIALPKSEAWVKENYFKSVMWDPNKAGAAADRNYKASVTEANKVLKNSEALL